VRTSPSTSPFPRHLAQQGFTLIEVVVVLFIIGIMASFAVIGMGGGGQDRVVEQEARRVTALLELVRDEGILTAREQAMGFTEHAYVFLRRYRVADRSYEWLPVEEDPTLRRRDLESLGVVFNLFVEGTRVALPRAGENPGAQVVIGAGGEMTAFELEIGTEGAREASWVLRGLPGGRIELRRL
jgi:general secretion pathway protein H